MNNKEKKLKETEKSSSEKETTPIRWELTDEDKAFLASCNISSE